MKFSTLRHDIIIHAISEVSPADGDSGSGVLISFEDRDMTLRFKSREDLWARRGRTCDLVYVIVKKIDQEKGHMRECEEEFEEENVMVFGKKVDAEKGHMRESEAASLMTPRRECQKEVTL
jgi:hypothetical protein